jgi:hypothetical protein
MPGYTIKDNVARVGIGDAVEVVWEAHGIVTLAQWQLVRAG